VYLVRYGAGMIVTESFLYAEPLVRRKRLSAPSTAATARTPVRINKMLLDIPIIVMRIICMRDKPGRLLSASVSSFDFKPATKVARGWIGLSAEPR
jgi:hypothetical protein